MISPNKIQLIDIYEDFGNSWNLIKIFRDKDGKKYREEIKDFEDYFYCTSKKLIEMNNNKNIKSQITHYEICDIPAYKCKEQIYQVFVKGIWSKYKIRKFLNNNLEDTFELDLAPSVRYTVDNIQNINKTNYRTIFFDIETSTDYGFPDWRDAKEFITCITLYDNYDKKYTSLILKPDEKSECNLKLTNDKKVILFDDEKKLIQKFIDIVIEKDYDLFTAWNISFDLTYIFGRCDKLGIDKFQLSPVGDASIKTKMNKQGREEIYVDIKQRFVVDLLLRYKGIIFKEIPSYSLDYVSKLELGIEDQKKKVTDFSKEWRENLNDLIEYSIRDVEVLVNLDNKLHLLSYLEEMRLINNLPNIQQAQIAKNLIDIAIFREYKNKLLLPSKGNLERQKIGGGYVKVPISNIYNNVAVYDFSGMYPSLIQTFNLSKDTVVPIDDADFVIHENDIDEEKMLRKGYKTGFSLKTRGIIPTILTKFLDVRRAIKKEMKKYPKDSIEYREMNLRQYALKAPINANYGVNAYPGFRLYEPRVAATITFLGRKLTQYCGMRIEEDYTDIKVLYSDTDSFFAEFPSNSKELIEEIKNKINTKYILEFIDNYGNGKIKKNYINVEFEKFFTKLFLVKKRRYLGIKDDGDWMYKGVDLARSNVPIVIKEILQEYIERLFNGDNLIDILKSCDKKLKNTTDIEKFKIPLKISKEYKTNLPQKRAANWSNKHLKTKLKIGSKFYGLYVIDKDTDIIGFTDLDDLKNYDLKLDIKKYTDILYKKIENLKRADDEISFDFSQTKLEEYF